MHMFSHGDNNTSFEGKSQWGNKRNMSYVGTSRTPVIVIAEAKVTAAADTEACPRVSKLFVMPFRHVLPEVQLQSLSTGTPSAWVGNSWQLQGDVRGWKTIAPIASQQKPNNKRFEQPRISFWQHFVQSIRTFSHSFCASPYPAAYKLCIEQKRRYLCEKQLIYTNTMKKEKLNKEQVDKEKRENEQTEKQKQIFAALFTPWIATTTMRIVDAWLSVIDLVKITHAVSRNIMAATISSTQAQVHQMFDLAGKNTDARTMPKGASSSRFATTTTLTTCTNSYIEMIAKPTYCYFMVVDNPSRVCLQALRPPPKCVRLWKKKKQEQEKKLQEKEQEDQQWEQENTQLPTSPVIKAYERSTKNDRDLTYIWTNNNTYLMDCVDFAKPELSTTAKISGTPHHSFCSVAYKRRQRHLSECSDDFICFEEDANSPQKPLPDDDSDEDDYSDDSTNESTEDEDDEFDEDDDEEFDHMHPCYRFETDPGNENPSKRLSCFKKLRIGPQLPKKVRFDMHPQVHTMRTWNYAHRSVRKVYWENFAVDRERFKNRIDHAALYLNPILDAKHRKKVFKRIFATQNESVGS